jgi:hypothetical protein
VFDYYNSLACELSLSNRLEEARNFINLAVASPYSRAYPEWLETRSDIEARRRPASRSIVAVEYASAIPHIPCRPRVSFSLVRSICRENKATVTIIKDWIKTKDNKCEHTECESIVARMMRSRAFSNNLIRSVIDSLWPDDALIKKALPVL